MNVQQIPLADISVGERLRAIDPDWVEFIAKSMLDRGQDTPIQVRKVGRSGKFALVAGAHRLAALKQIEEDCAVAIIVEADELQARLLEIDENLIRRELSALDRATFLAQRKAVFEEMYPDTKRGGDRRSDQAEARFGLKTFSRSTAERLGITERSVEIAVARYRNISDAVRAAITGTWLAESGRQLDELAKLTPDMQRKIASFVVQHPDIRKIGEIVRQIEGRAREPGKSRLEKFLAFWRKCDPDDRQSVVSHAAAQMPSVAFRAAWEKASEFERETIIEMIAPTLPGFAAREAA